MGARFQGWLIASALLGLPLFAQVESLGLPQEKPKPPDPKVACVLAGTVQRESDGVPLVFAWPDESSFTQTGEDSGPWYAAFLDPEFIKANASKAVPVKVAGSQPNAVKVEVIPAESEQ